MTVAWSSHAKGQRAAILRNTHATDVRILLYFSLPAAVWLQPTR